MGKHIENLEKEISDAADEVLKQSTIVLDAALQEKKKCSKKVNSSVCVRTIAKAESSLDDVIYHAKNLKNSARDYTESSKAMLDDMLNTPKLSDVQKERVIDRFIASRKKCPEYMDKGKLQKY